MVRSAEALGDEAEEGGAATLRGTSLTSRLA